MDAELWDSRWREEFPDVPPPSWPSCSDDVDAAMLESRARLESLQEEAKREKFRLLSLMFHLQMVQSAQPERAVSSAHKLRELSLDSSPMALRNESPEKVASIGTPTTRSRSPPGAGLLTPDDAELSSSPPEQILQRDSIQVAGLSHHPVASSGSSRKFVRRRRVTTRREGRPSSGAKSDDSDSEGEETKRATTPKLVTRESARNLLLRGRSSPALSPETGPSPLTQSLGSSEFDPRAQAHTRLQYLRQAVNSNAQKMILGVRRRRGSDGSITPTPRRLTLPQVLSPTEKFLPRNLYPSSLVCQGRAVGRGGVGWYGVPCMVYTYQCSWMG